MPNSSTTLSLKNLFVYFFSKKGGTAQIESKSKATEKKIKGVKLGKQHRKAAATLSVIGAGAIIEGNVYFENDVRFEGTIHGDITCKSALIIGPASLVTGNIEAEEITLEGHFEGELKAKEIIRVKQTANITGSVYAPRMSAEYGAVINGVCHIGA